jgi:hypothetical protein
MTLKEIEAYRNKKKVYKFISEWTLKVKPLKKVLKILYISALVSSTVIRTEILRNKSDAFNPEKAP